LSTILYLNSIQSLITNTGRHDFKEHSFRLYMVCLILLQLNMYIAG